MNMKKLNTYRKIPTTDWNNVQNFIDMWWFMPQHWHWDYSQLTDSQKAQLIDLCLDTIWRDTDELVYSLYIENIQSLLSKIK